MGINWNGVMLIEGEKSNTSGDFWPDPRQSTESIDHFIEIQPAKRGKPLCAPTGLCQQSFSSANYVLRPAFFSKKKKKKPFFTFYKLK